MAIVIFWEPSYKHKNIRIFISPLCCFSIMGNIQNSSKDLSFEDAVSGGSCCNQRVLMWVFNVGSFAKSCVILKQQDMNNSYKDKCPKQEKRLPLVASIFGCLFIFLCCQKNHKVLLLHSREPVCTRNADFMLWWKER